MESESTREREVKLAVAIRQFNKGVDEWKVIAGGTSQMEVPTDENVLFIKNEGERFIREVLGTSFATLADQLWKNFMRSIHVVDDHTIESERYAPIKQALIESIKMVRPEIIKEEPPETRYF